MTVEHSRKTALYSLHLDHGAKMVIFAGYQMPLHYKKGILHEHRQTRSRAGFFDISHMGQIMLSGDNVAGELEQLCPGNITGLQVGQQLYTVFTNAQGGVKDDLIIIRLVDQYMLIVNAACKVNDLAHIQTHLAEHCHVQELGAHSLFALQGPKAATIMQQFSTSAAALSFMTACNAELAGIPCLVSRSGYTGEDGFEISVANEYAVALADLLLAQNGVEPVGLGARDSLRLEAGLCLYGHELTESITPVEAGLQWIVKGQRSNYAGAEIIQDQLQHGLQKKRVGLQAEGRALVRDGCEIINDKDAVVGQVTSGGFGPSVGQPIAMAYIQIDEAYLGNKLFTLLRNRRVSLSICSLPFVPHRYHRK
jgi:glycine cleavage system T protein (aminomethyltransferase)